MMLAHDPERVLTAYAGTNMIARDITDIRYDLAVSAMALCGYTVFFVAQLIYGTFVNYFFVFWKLKREDNPRLYWLLMGLQAFVLLVFASLWHARYAALPPADPGF
jgi:hypothetical protein